MANKQFGVKEFTLIGSSGSPSLTSPNNLNLNANTVGISTNITIGGQVSSDLIVGSGFHVGIGTTGPTEALDVRGAAKVVGVVTATEIYTSNAIITGVSTFAGITTVTGRTLFAKQVNVSGVSTFAGITTVTGPTLFAKQLNVTGVATVSRLVSSGASLTSPLIVGITTATYGIRFASDPGASQYVHNIGPWYIIGYDTAAGYQNDAYLQFSPINSNYIIRNVGIGTTNPTSKLTVSGDGKFTGVVTATSFFGSGANLVDIDATQLTGSLPAIDGSQLLNVTAAGTGIAIRSNDTLVGSAVTVNFGTGLGVTFSSGIATITSTGGSLQSRTTVSGVTTSIPNLGIGNTDITGFKAYSLMRVGLSTAGWIRLYTDSTSRANDVTRSVGEDPAPGSGVIAEIVTTGISTQQMITPFAMGGNMDNPVTNKIYVAITNLSGTTQTITANLTILQLEA